MAQANACNDDGNGPRYAATQLSRYSNDLRGASSLLYHGSASIPVRRRFVTGPSDRTTLKPSKGLNKLTDLSRDQINAQDNLVQALELLRKGQQDELISLEVQAGLRSAACKTLTLYIDLMQDAEGHLPAFATTQVAAALKQIGVSSASEAMITDSKISAGVVDRLKSSVSTGIVAFGVISYWRGIWFLWDGMVYPDDPLSSGIASATVGLGVLLGARAFDVALAPPLTKMNPVAPLKVEKKEPKDHQALASKNEKPSVVGTEPVDEKDRRAERTKR
jgi:hypothetical protein